MSISPSAAAVHPLVTLHATLIEAEEFIARFAGTLEQASADQTKTVRANLSAQAVVVDAAIEAEFIRRATSAANAEIDKARS